MENLRLEVGDQFSFTIESLDLFGQGVHKQNEQVIFIPKTLPGEKGLATLTKKSKGVGQAKVESLTQASSQRQTPECPHFNECQGCSYLHTDYQTEVEAKSKAFKFQLRKLKQSDLPEIHFHQSPTRDSYRNRIQIHYDKPTKKIGFKSEHKIIEVPECKLPLASIQEYLQKLYQSKWWEQKNLKKQGHVEISVHPNRPQSRVQLNTDQRYAKEGFSQIHQQMNQRALKIIEQWIEKKIPQSINTLDLFGGQGNLSRHKSFGKTYVIDSTVKENVKDRLLSHQKYLKENLFSKNALKRLQKALPEDFGLIILDPPRSGFKQINDYAEFFKPEFIISMSCHSSTFIRDTNSLENYKIIELHQLDFFPSTSHFEVLALLERQS